MVRSSRITNPKIFIHIICEGHSGVTYCEQLNQYFNRHGIKPQFKLKPYPPKKTKGNKELTNCYKLLEYAIKIKNSNIFDKTDIMCILLDTDVFRDNPNYLETFKKACIANGIILLKQHQNFEDFLIMHLNDKDCQSWVDINVQYDNKMNGNQVSEEIKRIIPDYRKGKIPRSREQYIFCPEGLANVKAHNKNSAFPFKSDFVSEILEKKYQI